MCGIAGFVGRSDRAALTAMADHLTHRGPDGDGYYEDPVSGVQLAHRRLAILDVAGGIQPMATDDGALCIVFNGEIYNFKELRRELEQAGARFRTDHSDTEVVLLGWREWGEGLFDRLNGMWAFALHDRRSNELILARDRFGKKPLYYYAGADTFAFASELSALRRHPGAPVGLSTTAVRKYFAYGFVPAPLSIVEGANKLPAGHLLRLPLATRRPMLKRYWRYTPEPDAALNARPVDSLVEELVGLLEAAIARRLVADVPVGAFLSGGIDSSLVCALALRRTGRDGLKTFSIAFDDPEFDESGYARQVADHICAQHQVDACSLDEMRVMLPEILARLDEPMADASLLPTFLLCRHARKQVTVAIGGDGADELLAGYDPFKALRYARWYRNLVPRPMHQAISAVVARLPVSHRYMSLDFKLKRSLRGVTHPPRLWLPLWMGPLSQRELAELLEEPTDLESLYSEAIDAWDSCPTDDQVDKSTCFYVETYLQDDILTKVDRASMMNSLEVRAPFLDIDLVNFLRRLPSKFKLRGGETKWLLRRAAEAVLPATIVKRGKRGFAVPVGRWFREGHLPPPGLQRGVGSGFWRDRLAEHRDHAADHRLYLWSQLVLDAFR